MKKEFRLTRNEDFSKTVKLGKKIYSESYKVYYLSNELEHSRVGISTSKKLGNAVVRNKIRRQIRSIIDQNTEIFKLKIDLILVIKNDYLSKSFAQNKLLLEGILKNLGNYNEKKK